MWLCEWMLMFSTYKLNLKKIPKLTNTFPVPLQIPRYLNLPSPTKLHLITTFISQSAYPRTVWFRNSLQIIIPLYVFHIRFCCSAPILCVKSVVGVWYLWHNFRWHHVQDVGYTKEKFSDCNYSRRHNMAYRTTPGTSRSILHTFCRRCFQTANHAYSF